MTHSRLYISKIPNVSSLEAYIAKYDLPSKDGPALQLLKAKCRELSRSDSGLLVSPTHEALRTPFGATPELTLWIVAKVDYIKSAKPTKVLSNAQVKLQEKLKLSHTLLQTCYHFTLVARLAPKWNRVLSWLVQGCEFLTEGKGQGIDFQVGLTKDEITISVSVIKLSFSPMKADDLLTTSSLLNTFKRDPHCIISEGSIYNNRCFLLPNFTVGYIYSVSHFLPPGKNFQTYDQVRLHWKKQHGIILPEREALFYQVFFKGNPRKLFSYPGSCVYKNRPIYYTSRDTDLVASAFIADIHSRLPTVCGEQVKYCSRALALQASLQPPTQGLVHSNLKRLPPIRQALGSENIPAHLRADPIPKPAQAVPNISVPQQFSGARIVPIFKVKSRATSSAHTTVAYKPKPQATVIPTFKPTLSTGACLNHPGKRPAPNTLAGATKRPCLEHTLPQGLQALSQHSTIVAKKQPPTQRTTTPINKQTLHASTNSATIVKQTHTRPLHALDTNQIVPDLNSSVLEQFNDNSDFLPSNQHCTQALKKGSSVPRAKDKHSATSGTVSTGVCPDLLKKVNKMKAADLKKWLSDSGLKYRSKEKKEDLVRMVVQHIASTGKSFNPAT